MVVRQRLLETRLCWDFPPLSSIVTSQPPQLQLVPSVHILIVDFLGIFSVFDVDFLTNTESQARSAPECLPLALMYDEFMSHMTLV